MNSHLFESDKLQDIVPHIDKDTLFILDIDHTLIEPSQIIGSTHWERYIAQKLKQRGFAHHEASIRAFHQWRTIQHLTRVKPVEETIYDLLKYIQALEIKVLGLTARDGTLSQLTFDQLASVQLGNVFNFMKPSCDLVGSFPCRYQDGAVFCGFNSKDRGLDLFFQHYNYKPKKIVYVDDQQSHIEEIRQLTSDHKIEYVGMTYHASGAHKFDPQIAEIQEKYLPKLISNEEALDLLEA